MEIIKNINQVVYFNKDIYLKPPIFITSNKYWEGGIQTDSSLQEKSEFYCMSAKMSNIIQDIISTLNEPVFIGKSFCEYGDLYEHWSDLKKYELFIKISKIIHPKKHYRISLPEDSDVIDLIIESNFRYFSCIALYFPKTKLILQPTCHTEIIIYTAYPNPMVTMLETIVARHSDEKYKIVCKKTNEDM